MARAAPFPRFIGSDRKTITAMRPGKPAALIEAFRDQGARSWLPSRPEPREVATRTDRSRVCSRRGTADLSAFPAIAQIASSAEIVELLQQG